MQNKGSVRQTIAFEFDEQKIDAICSGLNDGRLPGTAIGIAVDSEPIYRKGFGLASMELPVVLSPAIRMRIASITKHFTCLAYLLLCEEGKARVDDPIGKYLPELHPVTHRVTVRQLMGHVSGLRDAHDIRHQFSGTAGPTSVADVLDLYREIESINSAPGTAWSYNNGGYLMLSVALERITGQPLDDVFRERIFERVGMDGTMLRRWDTDFVPNSATLHMSTFRGGFEKMYIGKEHMGEGGIVSTVDDMLRWLAHMDEPVVGTRDTWHAMKAPHTLPNGASTGYGLGLATNRYRGVEIVGHSGTLMGCNSHMLKVPAAHLDVVIMVNRHDVVGSVLTYRILDACLNGLDPSTVGPTTAPVAGIFLSPTSGRVIQLFASDGQQIASVNGSDWLVGLEEGGVLRPLPKFDLYRQSLTLLGDSARPASIRYNDFGNLDELFAVEPDFDADVAQIAGCYVSAETGTSLTISSTNEGPRLKSVGRLGSVTYRLESLAENIWRAKSMNPMPWGGILTSDRTGELLQFSTERTRSLVFRRNAGR